MSRHHVSRRKFFGGTAAGALTAAVSAVSDPGRAAAQAVGVKPADLPDLTIKEVKIYVLKPEPPRAGAPVERARSDYGRTMRNPAQALRRREHVVEPDLGRAGAGHFGGTTAYRKWNTLSSGSN